MQTLENAWEPEPDGTFILLTLEYLGARWPPPAHTNTLRKHLHRDVRIRPALSRT